MSICEVIEHPILFSAPMVRAVLDGSKTQTRRVIKPQPTSNGLGERGAERFGENWFRIWSEPLGYSSDVFSPYTVGHRLWVRETWADVRGQGFDNDLFPVGVSYKAECDAESLRIASEYRVKWKPSIHMPRWASRITLKITAVCVERVQDISEEDAKAEGATDTHAFRKLWDSMYAVCDSSWGANPWVWVIQFERL